MEEYYNINYNVKYYEIQQELCNKLNFKQQNTDEQWKIYDQINNYKDEIQNNNIDEQWKIYDQINNYKDETQNNNIDEQYSNEDIDCICRKLYLDEISSVFNSEDFLDDKIDVGFRKIYELLIENNLFNEYIIQLTLSYTTNDQLENMKYFSFLSLFDMKLFYLTHQLICYYLTTNDIERNLFEKIKQLNTIFSEK
jgi:hypothetical protein